MTETTFKPKKRKKFSYISVIISISMVLFMLGLLGILFIESNNIVKSIKENMMIQLFLTDDISQKEVDELMNKINTFNAAKNITYISKEQAAQEFAAELGQDFVNFLGFNPLMPSIQITLKSDFNNNYEIVELEHKLKILTGVAEVSYQKNIYDKLNENFKSISLVLIFLAVIFTVISVVLINNTVRLNLFAKRFTIKSMQLVGATNWFIIKPIIYKSLINGLLGGIFAIALLVLVLNSAPNFINEISNFYNYQEFIALFVVLLIIGLVISVLSSWLCTLKYLNTKIEDLY